MRFGRCGEEFLCLSVSVGELRVELGKWSYSGGVQGSGHQQGWFGQYWAVKALQ